MNRNEENSNLHSWRKTDMFVAHVKITKEEEDNEKMI